MKVPKVFQVYFFRNLILYVLALRKFLLKVPILNVVAHLTSVHSWSEDFIHHKLSANNCSFSSSISTSTYLHSLQVDLQYLILVLTMYCHKWSRKEASWPLTFKVKVKNFLDHPFILFLFCRIIRTGGGDHNVLVLMKTCSSC